MKKILFAILFFPLAIGLGAQTTNTVVMADSTIYIRQETLIPITVDALDKQIAELEKGYTEAQAQLQQMSATLTELKRLRQAVISKQVELKSKQ